MSHIRAEMHKFDFGWGSNPPRWGNLQRSPESLAGFKGPYFQERKEGSEKGEGEKGGRGKVKDGKGKGTECDHPMIY